MAKKVRNKNRPSGAFDIASLNRTALNATESGLIKKSLVPNFTKPNPLSLYNPADPFSPTGLIGNMGGMSSETKLAIRQKTDKNLADAILDNSQKNALSSPSYDLNQYIQNMYAMDGISGINGRSLQDSEGDPYSLDTFQMLSSIPRTYGVLGTFAVPRSKVSFNALYNATNDSIFGSIDLIRSKIISSFRQYQHKNKDVQKLINKTLDSIGREKFFLRCCDFIIAGNACGQIIWDTLSKGYHYISDIVWAPYTDLQYQIDYFGNVIGAAQPSMIAPILGMFCGYDSDCGESLFSQRQIIPQIMPYLIVPRDQLFYIAYDADFDPYGSSIVRKAYPYYLLKQAVLGMYMTAMSINGAPMVVLYYDKIMTQSQEQIDIMYSAMNELALGGVCKLPSQKGKGYEVEVLPLNSGGLAVFQNMLDYCDRMAKAALFPGDNMLGNTGSGSYSSGVVSENAFQQMYSLHTSYIKRAFHEQIEAPMIQLNFPDLYEKRDFGTWVSESASTSEVTEAIQQFEIGANCQLFDPTNLELVNGFMQRMGLPIYASEKDLPAVKNPDFQGKERLTNDRALGRPFANNSGKPHKKDDYVSSDY